MPESTSKREPKALSSEYHKAHKQVMLWSGILFIWELVGIDLTKAQMSGGHLAAVISAIKSPQAVPWAFVILVTYSLFKFTVEWYQCSPDRRTMRVARIDFVFAWITSLMAYTLFLGQTISRVQFADFLQDPVRRNSLLVGMIVGVTGPLFVGFIRKRAPLNQRDTRRIIIVMVIFSVVMLLLFRFVLLSLEWRFIFVAMISGACFSFAPRLILRAFRHK